MKNRASSALGGGKKSKKSKKNMRHVHEMHIRHAANGGYIAKHDIKNDQGGMDNEEHAIPDLQTLQAHVGDHMDQSQMPAPGAAAAPGGDMPLRGGM